MAIQKIIQQSERITRQRRKRFFRIVIYLLILFISLLVAMYYVFRLPFFALKDVSVSGNLLVSKDEVKNKTEEVLSGSYLFIVPKNNFLFYPKREIQSSIEKKFPRIKSVKISANSKILNISIEEKSAVNVWCNDKCYFFDEDGNIFAPAPDYSGSVYTIFSSNLNGDPIGQKILSKEMLKKINDISKVLEGLGFPILKVNIESKGGIDLISSSNTKFIIDLTSDPKLVTDNASAIFASKEFKDSTKNNNDLDYIDLRFGNKVYFRTKENIPVVDAKISVATSSVASTTATSSSSH